MVTFRDFRHVATKRRRTVDELVDIFHGQLDENRPFFERVMTCRSKGKEDLSKVVIPYKSVLEYYFKEKSHLEDLEQSKNRVLAA